MRSGISEHYYVITICDPVSKKRKFISKTGVTSDKLEAKRYSKGQSETAMLILKEFNPVVLHGWHKLMFRPVKSKPNNQRTFT